MSAPHPLKRILLLTFRYGLLLVGLVYLYFTVDWVDTATLADTQQDVRVIEQLPGELEIVRDDRGPERLPFDQFVLQDGAPVIRPGLMTVMRQLDLRLALLGLVLALPVPLIQSLRLLLLLRVQAVSISYFVAARLTFAGNFFNFALPIPGRTGGDLLKAFYLTRYTHQKAEAVTTVFLDRVIGLLGILTVAGGMIALQGGGLLDQRLLTILIVAGVGVFIGALVILMPRVRRALRLRAIVERLPLSAQLIRAGSALIKLQQHPMPVLGAFICTLAQQFMLYLAAFSVARGLQMDGSFWHYLTCLPIGFLIAAIPSSPQAVGVMEWAYIQFFVTESLNNAAGQAVALALAVRLLELVWALPGGLVPLLGLHVPKVSELQAFGASPDERSDTKSVVRDPAPATGGAS